jgi:hypothetical protein
MSGFDADWLALREPADARARSRRLARALRAQLAPTAGREQPLEVVDLGGGTGANLRWLAPVLGGRLRWRSVDDDPALNAALASHLGRWAEASGFTCAVPAGAAADSPIQLTGTDFEVSVETETLDLATGLEALALPVGGLVTASALLDLVGRDWTNRLSSRIAAAGAAALFALSYDGRAGLTPAEPADRLLRELVNRHQGGDKGFGPALGPAAAGHTASALMARGYRLYRAASDWRLGPAEAGLQRLLIAGWADAARAIAPATTGDWLDDWRARREAQIDAAALRIAVGHEDLLALPPADAARDGLADEPR